MSDDDDDMRFIDASYQVGYGRAPEGTRFKPGRSGNPRGRPKRKKPDYCEGFGIPWLSELIRTEAYREVTIRENGKSISMPAIQAALRNNLVGAIKGSRLHLKHVMEALNGVEQHDSAERQKLFDQALSGKRWWQQQCEFRAARGLPPPRPPVPHPDDIILDVIRGTVEVCGPQTDAEQLELEEMLRHRDQLLHICQTALATEDDPDALERRELLDLTQEIERINAVIPARLRRSV